MRKGDTIELIYLTSRGNKLSQRTIRIMDVNETYIKAYCYSRKEVRIFRKDHILASRIIRRVS
ncbi:hypothetical protein [Sporolactobacillus laevolacticus]|uniref:WYL domain-containing protein n=1 Tax=Sporolactobacillus laevolacticus DSM 442 TaxID=1395513 RepID=V6IXU5_9BACL|nr:hypothetical protein [Sporolactobacillus laevolacticus]EST12177.1 hypothetical protein P343_08945 [Sporolactobacillus laevolacticus DSM 442]